MTVPPVIIPEQQFNDADGHPYAGGSLTTYVPGTTTPKQTWLDPGQAALNTNPIILDAAGRCLLYGDGDYRLSCAMPLQRSGIAARPRSAAM
jgi:hypothetical protein